LELLYGRREKGMAEVNEDSPRLEVLYHFSYLIQADPAIEDRLLSRWPQMQQGLRSEIRETAKGILQHRVGGDVEVAVSVFYSQGSFEILFIIYLIGKSAASVFKDYSAYRQSAIDMVSDIRSVLSFFLVQRVGEPVQVGSGRWVANPEPFQLVQAPTPQQDINTLLFRYLVLSHGLLLLILGGLLIWVVYVGR